MAAQEVKTALEKWASMPKVRAKARAAVEGALFDMADKVPTQNTSERVVALHMLLEVIDQLEETYD